MNSRLLFIFLSISICALIALMFVDTNQERIVPTTAVNDIHLSTIIDPAFCEDEDTAGEDFDLSYYILLTQ